MSRGRSGGWLVPLAMLGLANAVFGHWLTTAQGRAALGEFAPFLPWFYLMQHAAMFLALAAWFAASLRPGQDPLVTRFALLVEGALSPSGLVYTRRVTLAWALFCVTTAGISALLFLAAPLPIWSVFANLLTLPLVGAMFVAEYLVRRRVCPELGHGGVARGVLRSVRAYWDSVAGASAGRR